MIFSLNYLIIWLSRHDTIETKGQKHNARTIGIRPRESLIRLWDPKVPLKSLRSRSLRDLTLGSHGTAGLFGLRRSWCWQVATARPVPVQAPGRPSGKTNLSISSFFHPGAPKSPPEPPQKNIPRTSRDRPQIEHRSTPDRPQIDPRPIPDRP